MTLEKKSLKQEEFQDADSTLSGYLELRTVNLSIKKWKKCFVRIGNGKIILIPNENSTNTTYEASLRYYAIDIIPFRSKLPFWTFKLKPAKKDKTLKTLELGASSGEEMKTYINILTKNIYEAQSQANMIGSLKSSSESNLNISSNLQTPENRLINQEYPTDNVQYSLRTYAEYEEEDDTQSLGSQNISRIAELGTNYFTQNEIEVLESDKTLNVLKYSTEDTIFKKLKKPSTNMAESLEDKSIYATASLVENSSASLEDRSIYGTSNVVENPSVSQKDKSVYAKINPTASLEDRSIYWTQNSVENISLSQKDKSIYATTNPSASLEDLSIYGTQNSVENISLSQKDKSIYATTNPSTSLEDRSIYGTPNVVENSSVSQKDKSVCAKTNPSASLEDRSVYGTINVDENTSFSLEDQSIYSNNTDENGKMTNIKTDHSQAGTNIILPDSPNAKIKDQLVNQNISTCAFDINDILFLGSKVDASKMLFRLNHLGGFLVRQEEDKQVLTVQTDLKVEEYILKTNLKKDKIRINGEIFFFENLERLLSYYMDNDLPRQNLKLTIPYNVVDKILC